MAYLVKPKKRETKLENYKCKKVKKEKKKNSRNWKI